MIPRFTKYCWYICHIVFRIAMNMSNDFVWGHTLMYMSWTNKDPRGGTSIAQNWIDRGVEFSLYTMVIFDLEGLGSRFTTVYEKYNFHETFLTKSEFFLL